jgi:hypothetical protein
MTTETQDKLIADWVAALRSGEYKQAKGHLCGERTGGYCCLGVAGKLIGLTDDQLYTSNSYPAYTAVKDAYGLRTDLGYFGNDGLAMRNDGGASFEKIADIIESRPEGLFV